MEKKRDKKGSYIIRLYRRDREKNLFLLPHRASAVSLSSFKLNMKGFCFSLMNISGV